LTEPAAEIGVRDGRAAVRGAGAFFAGLAFGVTAFRALAAWAFAAFGLAEVVLTDFFGLARDDAAARLFGRADFGAVARRVLAGDFAAARFEPECLTPFATGFAILGVCLTVSAAGDAKNRRSLT